MSNLSQFFGGGGGVGSDAPTDLKLIEVLLVGGGGGGVTASTSNPVATGGSGGAGGMVECNNFVVINGTEYVITIGGGGSVDSPGTESTFTQGSSSIGIFASGGSTGDESGDGNGSAGGNSSTSAAYAVTRNTSKFGFNFFNFIFKTIFTMSSYNGDSSITVRGGGAGRSGSGRTNSITGSPVSYAQSRTSPAPSSPANRNGSSNSGEGAAGGYYRLSPSLNRAAGTGGSGVCVIRWPTAYPDASSVTGNAATPAQPGYYVYRWDGVIILVQKWKN